MPLVSRCSFIGLFTQLPAVLSAKTGFDLLTKSQEIPDLRL
jgi:hypothetical protein